MTITKDLLKALRADCNAALAEVAKKHGVILQVGNASFSGETATFKLEVAKTDGATQGESIIVIKARDDWATYAPIFGMEAEWLGQSFRRSGSTYKILGVMPKRSKYPILVSKDGKEILMQDIDVKQGMTLARVAPVAAGR